MWAAHEGGRLGATSYVIDAGIDTGPVLRFEAIPPRPEESLFAYRARVMARKPEILFRTVEDLAAGRLAPQPQEPDAGTLHRPMSAAELAATEAAFAARAAPDGADLGGTAVAFLRQGGNEHLLGTVEAHWRDLDIRPCGVHPPRSDRLPCWLWQHLCHPAAVFYALGVQLWGNRFRAARWLGRKTVLHWIGTDVWYMLTDPARRETVRRTVLPHVDAHWTVSAANAAELREALGIEPRVVPIVDYAVTDVPEPPPPATHSALTYVSREDPVAEERYGLPTVLAVARRFPTVPFRVVGHGGRGLPAPPNVRFLGYVEEMAGAYRETSVYIRVRHQDGLPKLVLESLAWGREVIFTDPFPHCHRAHTEEEVAAALAEILSRPPRLNRPGRNYVLETFSRPRVTAAWRAALADLLAGGTA
jgi:hypothetical protein